jgi:hypothetical protein
MRKEAVSSPLLASKAGSAKEWCSYRYRLHQSLLRSSDITEFCYLDFRGESVGLSALECDGNSRYTPGIFILVHLCVCVCVCVFVCACVCVCDIYIYNIYIYIYI